MFFCTVYRRLFGYGAPNCTHCGYPNLVCSCSLRQKLTTSSRQSMILLDPVDSIERVEGPAGGNGTSHASSSSSNGNSNSSSSSSSYQPSLSSGITTTGHSDTSNERSSASFRASTSIQQFRVRPAPRSTVNYNRHELGLFSDEDDTINLFEPPKMQDFSHGNRPRESSESSIEVIASPATVDATTSSAATVDVTISSAANVDATTSYAATVVATTTSSAERETNKELDEFNARLLSLIECPVCLEPISPPVHQCRRGHLVKKL